jgi:hypothetical protein
LSPDPPHYSPDFGPGGNPREMLLPWWRRAPYPHPYRDFTYKDPAAYTDEPAQRNP